mgnify:CR=1 FL=1
MSLSDARSIPALSLRVESAKWLEHLPSSVISTTLRTSTKCMSVKGSFVTAALPYSFLKRRVVRRNGCRSVADSPPHTTSNVRCTCCHRLVRKYAVSTRSVHRRWCPRCSGLFDEWCIVTRPKTRGLDTMAAEREFEILFKRQEVILDRRGVKT